MENNQNIIIVFKRQEMKEIVEKHVMSLNEWMKQYHSDDETNKDSNHWN